MSGFKIIDTSVSFTRPANTTAYSSSQLVANSTTNTSVVPLKFYIGYGQTFKVCKAGVKFNSATNTNAQFKLHLYNQSPTVTNGDGAAWLSTESGYQGNIAIDCTAQTFSDNSKGIGVYINTSVEIPLLCVCDANNFLYGLLMATAAYTPTSAEVFTVNLVGECFV